jgi:hypothetical protein
MAKVRGKNVKKVALHPETAGFSAFPKLDSSAIGSKKRPYKQPANVGQ